VNTSLLMQNIELNLAGQALFYHNKGGVFTVRVYYLIK